MKWHFSKPLFLLFLSLLTVSKSESIEELIQPKCDGKTIKYSIYANFKEYLENENNIDKRQIYNSLDDLKNKRIGIYTPTYADHDKLKMFDNIKEYEDKDELVSDLLGYKMDGGILFQGLTDTIQMYSNLLSIYPEPLYSVNLGFGLKKDSGELKTQLNKFIQDNKNNFKDLELYWDLVNNEAGYLNMSLNGTKVINVIAKIDSSPYCYLRQFDNALIGAEVDFIYQFAREFGYKLNFIEAKTYEEQYEALKKNKADIALGFFVIKEDNDISFSNVLYTGNINLVVRYSNLPESVNIEMLYDSIEDFNGQKLGLEAGTFYDELSTKYFPDSEFVIKDNVSDLIKLLLYEEIEGFLFDKPVAEYFEKKYNWRLTYYEINDIEQHKNAFAFQQNIEGEALLKEFNEFLKTIDLKEIYNKWNVADWGNSEDYDNDKLFIEKDLDPKGKLITVAFHVDMKPVCYFGQNEPKGVEMDIIYKFAKAQNYSINFIPISAEERMTYIKEGKANITGGGLSITEERKKFMSFSDPLYDCPSVMIVRTDSKKDKIPIEILDSKFETKNDTNVDVNVKFGDKIKTSSCAFPKIYSDQFLINCTISDIKDVNPSNGFEYVNTTDKITFLYSYIEADNFFQANSKIDGHKDIIKESNKNKITCSSPPSNSLIPLLSIAFIPAVLALVYIISKCI